ncbi:MAG TPA: hypothetical protein VGQ76_28600, partial [Thermoanaerobaculia bacterium]|nr:hypothetical protein [Thermoanaerobaculia bacterium]
MRPLLRLTLGVALSILAAPSLLAAMRGVVFDLQGDSVASARVTAHRWEPLIAERARMLAGTPSHELAATTTDEHGAFTFDWKVGGVVELRVERDRHAPSRQFVLADDELVFVELKRAPTRTGHVTANGKPVSNALVVAHDASRLAWSTRTKDDGTYTIPDPKLWVETLEFVHPDFAPLSTEDMSRLDVVLLPGTSVSGTVSDASGRPVPKANVFAGDWTRTITKDDGTFVLQHVATDEKQLTAIDGVSFGTVARKEKDVALRIERLGTITGTVSDANQRPLEGVPVYAGMTMSRGLKEWRETNAAVTDAKGNYSILHCDASDYTVDAYATSALELEDVKVTLRNSLSARADLTATKTDFIVGTVVDEQKRPVSGATVQFTVSVGPVVYGFIAKSGMTSARTGRDGKFRLAGNLLLFDNKFEVRLQAIRRGYAAGVSEQLKRDGGPQTIVMPAGIEFAGLVTNAEDKPVAGAGIVLLQNPSGAEPTPIEGLMALGTIQPFTETDAAGRFSVRLNSIVHDIGVWKEGYAGQRVGNLTPRPGDAPLKIVLGASVEIRGRVTAKGTAKD